MKIKLNVTEECTVSGYSINDEELSDLLDVPEGVQKVKDILYKLIEREEDDFTLQDIFKQLVSSQGEYKYRYHCEQCGYDVYEYNLEID